MNDIKALIKLTFIGLAILMLAGCYGMEFRPHPLSIVADEQGCPTAIGKREQNVCTAKTGEEGLCVQPGDWVKWGASDNTKAIEGFSINFVADRSTPMDESCTLTTTDETLKCRVAQDAEDGDYKYSVVVTDCPVLDPRIIVRKSLK